MADGTTRSKHYSNMRLKDWRYIGATGSSVGVWMVRSNHEGDSGGPFYRSLLNQCGTDQEITYILNYGEGQTEPFRTGILNGPYVLAFTSGEPPPELDTTWVSGMGLVGYVGPAGRGAVSCPGIHGRDTSYEYTAALANPQAQYWAGADPDTGSFLVDGVLPGTYTLRLFKGEYSVYEANVSVAAGITNGLSAITVMDDPSTARPLWRIGNWDGSPREFLNGDKITTMHPSDVRMGQWNQGPYVVGVSTPGTGMPCYHWKDVNGGQNVQFTLTAAQLVASTVRVGITCAFSGARPKISVNSWNLSYNPDPSSQPDSRTLTVGTYRGNNAIYTFSVPASAFVEGTNTLNFFPISGSGGSGFLSPGYSLDCVELYQGSLVTLPVAAAPRNLSGVSTNLEVTLRWNPSAGATGFVVERAIAAGGPYEVLASNVAATVYRDNALPQGTCYYRVRGRNTSGVGTNTAPITVVAGRDLRPTLIAAGSAWRYNDLAVDLGTAWRANGFNDASWRSGPARLGYGGDGEATTVGKNGQWTTYFRRTFFVGDPLAVKGLGGRVTRDDAVIVHLNGTEIWRDTNITSGVVSYSTPALLALGGAAETEWLTLDLGERVAELLVPGWNTLAAEVHNQSLSSSDIGFDLELTGDVIEADPPELTVSKMGAGVRVSWPATASFYELFTSTNVSGNWIRESGAPIFGDDVWSVTVPAFGSGRRYYRLQLE